jgi:hypothetical protein
MPDFSHRGSLNVLMTLGIDLARISLSSQQAVI